MIRRERFEITRPDGVVLVVDRNIETGEQTTTVKGLVAVEPPAPIVPTEPRGNASIEAWSAWADHLGVEYPEDARRNDIKALILSAAK
jgi:hypothetical protein